jgi:hypothetical protein
VLGGYPTLVSKELCPFQFWFVQTGFDQIGTDFQNWNQNLHLHKTRSNPASTFHLCVEPEPRQFQLIFLELEPEFFIKVKNHTTSFHTLNYNHPHTSPREAWYSCRLIHLRKFITRPSKTLPSPCKLLFPPFFMNIFTTTTLLCLLHRKFCYNQSHTQFLKKKHKFQGGLCMKLDERCEYSWD